jgi:hypothetical protein
MRAYVINLDKDGARLARVTRECVAAAIPCERFPAVEGRRLAPASQSFDRPHDVAGCDGVLPQPPRAMATDRGTRRARDDPRG